MESRVTRSASFSSLQPSVPAGRIGSTMKRVSAVESQTRTSVSFGSVDAEVVEHAARVLHGARAVRRRLVPDRRQAEHLPRIAGAQRADDHVVALRRVLDRDQMIADAAHVAHRGDRLGGVRQQRLLERRIGPGLGDHDRAVPRSDLGLVGLDDGVERGRVDIALLGQHGFQRADAKLRLRQLRAVLVVVRGHDRGRVRPWGPPGDLRYNIAMPETSRTIALADRIDRLNAAIGRTVAWLCLLVVLVQFAVVVMRYVFGAGLDLADRDDHLRPRHACSCWRRPGRLRDGGHVRVDIFYADAGPRRRALIDLGGALFLLLPFMLVLLWFAVPYVARSWAILETSRETSGLPGGVPAQDADPAVRRADGVAGHCAGDPGGACAEGVR